MKRFWEGQRGRIGGVHWRIVRGRKTPSDLRLDLYCPEWTPVKMDVGFLFADFYAQNERTLAREGYLPDFVADDPGRRYLNFLGAAQFLGWQIASEQLADERSRKRSA